MQLKITQQQRANQEKTVVIDSLIAGGYDPIIGKTRYYQTDCIETLIECYKRGETKMLVHMATGLGKTRTLVALSKALLVVIVNVVVASTVKSYSGLCSE